MVRGIRRVLLIVRPRLLSDLIQEAIKCEADIEVITFRGEESDSLEEYARWHPDVLIQTWPNENRPGGYCKLLAECPGMVIISISSHGDCIQIRNGASGQLQSLVSSWKNLNEMMRRNLGTLYPASYRTTAPAWSGFRRTYPVRTRDRSMT